MLGLQDILKITAKTVGPSVISGLYEAQLPTAAIPAMPFEYARESPGPTRERSSPEISRSGKFPAFSE
jgi:hypothetical protein